MDVIDCGLSVRQKETVRIAVGVALGGIDFIEKPFKFEVALFLGPWNTSVVRGKVGNTEEQDAGNKTRTIND